MLFMIEEKQEKAFTFFFILILIGLVLSILEAQDRNYYFEEMRVMRTMLDK